MIIQSIPRLLAAIVTLSGAVCAAHAAETVAKFRIEEPIQESNPFFSILTRRFGNSQVWASVGTPPFDQHLSSSTFTVYTKEEVDGALAAKDNEIRQLRTMYQLLSASHDALAKRIDELEQRQSK